VNARALLSLLFHADKALDLVGTAHDLGLLARLDAGPVTLRSLVEGTQFRPLRLYKFLDGLESLGLIRRRQPGDDPYDAEYESVEALAPAASAVLSRGSIERDRNENYPWREIHGRLREVLAGQQHSRFSWPPTSAAEISAFEQSMAAGCPPIIEALCAASEVIFGDGLARWLDVGGGDGTVAVGVLGNPSTPAWVQCDVFNLPATAALVQERASAAGLAARIGSIGGDFLNEPLPRGYDVLSFVRVLHDWPADVARRLLLAARDALVPGGRIVICEEFRSHDRLAVQLFWTYFLIGADACVSRLRETEWYTDALRMLGFQDIRVITGPFDVVVATRG
jgi:demethylspheroidene O-methyltransferase